MENKQHDQRHIVRKLNLSDESGFQEPIGTSPAERLKMMWQITQDCWAFVPGNDAKREFQRHVTRVERRGS